MNFTKQQIQSAIDGLIRDLDVMKIVTLKSLTDSDYEYRCKEVQKLQKRIEQLTELLSMDDEGNILKSISPSESL